MMPEINGSKIAKYTYYYMIGKQCLPVYIKTCKLSLMAEIHLMPRTFILQSSSPLEKSHTGIISRKGRCRYMFITENNDN